MKCPYCGGKSRILDTRVRKDGTKWRRHVCPYCDQKFSTMEIYAGDYRQVKHLIKGEAYGR